MRACVQFVGKTVEANNVAVTTCVGDLLDILLPPSYDNS